MVGTFYRHEAEDSAAFAIRASKSTDTENTQLRHQLANQSKFVDVGRDSKGESVKIRYCVLGTRKPGSAQAPDNRPRVLMIMGLAASLDAWKPQIHDIMSIPVGGTEPPVVMCLLDNRGVGWSSSPEPRKDYSSTIMAKDSALVMDEIGWDKAHLVGFSMGGMVASKFAALWPHRVGSLTLIASTRGGWDTIPRSIRAWKYVLKLARDKTPHTKATVDLKFHFMRKTLQKQLPGWGRRRDGLLQEYIQSQSSNDQDSRPMVPSAAPSIPPSAADSAAAPASAVPGTPDGSAQSASTRPSKSNLTLPFPPNAAADSPVNEISHLMSPNPAVPHSAAQSRASGSVSEHSSDAGLRGQMHTCWTHKMSEAEEAAVKEAKFPVLCIHGRHDIVAEPRFGEKLAAQLEATLVMLEGAHFIPRECGHQVSLLIENLVLGQSRALERAHLDPERHMQPEVVSSQADGSYSGIPDYAGDPDEHSAPAGLRLNASAKRSDSNLAALDA